MTPYDAWLPWFYQYGIGGLMAGATVVFSVKAGALNFSHRVDRRLAGFLAAGYFGFCAIHAAWIWGVMR